MAEYLYATGEPPKETAPLKPLVVLVQGLVNWLRLFVNTVTFWMLAVIWVEARM